MSDSDKVFTGSIPAIYDRFLGPLLFQPYAEDLVRRVAKLSPKRVLETAAGTGLVTERLVNTLAKDVAITATDLNQAMLNIASGKVTAPNVAWQACDATHLPFPDHAFDAVVCQFGVMFFPDKLTACHEARRVLRSGGTFLFNVWTGLDANELPRLVSEAVASAFPEDPPDFIARTPHGYHDINSIIATLGAAGFKDVISETVRLRSKAASAQDVATGFCQGSPLRNEIERRDAGRLEEVTKLAADAVASRFGPGQIDAPMEAIIFAGRA